MAWTTPRTFVAGEVETAAIFNTHLRDNMNVGRGLTRSTLTSGDLTLNSTAAANVSTSVDLTISAATNDRLVVFLSGFSGNEAVEPYLDCYPTASSTYFSVAGFAGSGATNEGLAAWISQSGLFTSLGGEAVRTLVSGDVSGGNVVVRLRYKTSAGTNKTFYADTNKGFEWFVLNLGPAV